MDNQYKGMTVNERLNVSNLFDAFYKAASEKDVQKIRRILEKIEIIDELAILPILRSLGLVDNR